MSIVTILQLIFNSIPGKSSDRPVGTRVIISCRVWCTLLSFSSLTSCAASREAACATGSVRAAD